MELNHPISHRARHAARWRALILLPFAALALASCAQRWAKPGATDTDFRIARTRCEAIGYERLPPDLRWMQISTGHVMPGRRHCWTSNGQQRCSHVPGHFVPPRFGHVDRNDAPRDRFVATCLIDDGWEPVD
jgi:hypothetical protein